MKKRVLSFALALCFLLGCPMSALAADADSQVSPRASLYLSRYGIAVSASDNHRIAMTITIDATGLMTRVGVQELYIEYKDNGVWKEFDTLYGVDHPEFYQYDTVDYYDTLYFTGVAGVQYRVTVTAFAMNSTGSDTGTVTSYVVTCN